MVTINISLPTVMKEWVDAQTNDGRYTDASDYMRNLIRKEQEDAEKNAMLRAMFVEGRSSPSRIVNRDELLTSIKSRLGLPHGMATE